MTRDDQHLESRLATWTVWGGIILFVLNMVLGAIGLGGLLRDLSGGWLGGGFGLVLGLVLFGGLVIAWLEAGGRGPIGGLIVLGCLVLAPFSWMALGVPTLWAVLLAASPLVFYRLMNRLSWVVERWIYHRRG